MRRTGSVAMKSEADARQRRGQIRELASVERQLRDPTLIDHATHDRQTRLHERVGRNACSSAIRPSIDADCASAVDAVRYVVARQATRTTIARVRIHFTPSTRYKSDWLRMYPYT